MSREVIWAFDALESLLDLHRRDRPQAIRILRAIQAYATSDRGDIKKLAGATNEWRLRVGDWRVIFAPRPDQQAMQVLAIRLRRDAYD